jgi:hypothetical protein
MGSTGTDRISMGRIISRIISRTAGRGQRLAADEQQ